MTEKRKGLILAGGKATRLYPLTYSVSKQLLPVYDKPMIYYPISTLMLAGIRDFLIIVSPENINLFENLIGDGSDWGISVSYAIQEKPQGLAQAFIIGEDFIGDSPSALVLGDNLFHGDHLAPKLKKVCKNYSESSILVYPVKDPERYGVAEFDNNKKVINIEEKPINPKSRFAVTGLYFYDKTVVQKAKRIKPSGRGELEITSINNLYLKDQSLNVEIMGRGMTWLDTGKFDSLHEAGTYIQLLEKRQGLKVGCPEEIAWREGWINNLQLERLARKSQKSGYGEYLLEILNDPLNNSL